MINLVRELTEEADDLTGQIQVKKEASPNEILDKLLKNIGKVDFKTLTFPEYPKIQLEHQELKDSLLLEDGTLNEDNKADLKAFKKLTRRLEGFKLNKSHYLINSIEQLNNIAIKNKWKLCKRLGLIYLYNGCYWVQIDNEHFQSFLGNVALKMGINKFIAKHHTFREQLFKQFLSDSYLEAPAVKDNTVLINLMNGTFEVTGANNRLRGFDAKDFLTYQLPFEYDADAKAPLFKKFLNEVIPNEEKQLVLAEYIGSLFVKTSVLKLEKVLFLYGTGANGKSVFFEIVSALLGKPNVSNYSLESLTDSNGYYRAKIVDKLVNYATEINSKLKTDVFKTLASGEPIEARLPYGEPFNVSEYAKLIFNGNELPTDVEHTNAFFRRFIILHFDITIADNIQDKELATKIINNELAGVFNWVLSALERLLKQKKFSKCDAVDNALADYQAKSDSVKMFIDEEGYERSADERELIKDLYISYRNFCIEDGYRAVKKSNFISRLKHHKVTVNKVNVGNVAYLKRL